MLFFLDRFPSSGLLLLWGTSIVSGIASAYWINDYYDYDDDRVNTRKALHPSKEAALVPALLALVVSLVSGSFASVQVFLTALTIGFTSFLYSSPSTRLKSRLFLPFFIHFFMGVVFFQSASSLGSFHWARESIVMALFWGLVLGTGSLGNEMVDQSVDERARIRTVANSYPGFIRRLIFGIQGIALFLLIADMVFLNLWVTLFTSVSIGATYGLWYFGEGKNSRPMLFRRIYRIVFILIVLAFHAEKFFRS